MHIWERSQKELLENRTFWHKEFLWSECGWNLSIHYSSSFVFVLHVDESLNYPTTRVTVPICHQSAQTGRDLRTGERGVSQMANRLSFVFTVMLRTEGCDISQEDFCVQRSLVRESFTHPAGAVKLSAPDSCRCGVRRPDLKSLDSQADASSIAGRPWWVCLKFDHMLPWGHAIGGVSFVCVQWLCRPPVVVSVVFLSLVKTFSELIIAGCYGDIAAMTAESTEEILFYFLAIWLLFTFVRYFIW